VEKVDLKAFPQEVFPHFGIIRLHLTLFG
ncbi:uncharacterized protein METZ01_LOCUS307672, partial [marine metagenome]